jgi:hypothetical protein
MMPISAKDAGLATPGFGFFYHPIDELLARRVVVSAVVSHPKMDVSEHYSLGEIYLMSHDDILAYLIVIATS